MRKFFGFFVQKKRDILSSLMRVSGMRKEENKLFFFISREREIKRKSIK
jgi:hypothetical protein